MMLNIGNYIWVPCEVMPGAFSDERMVRVESKIEDWVGFVPTVFLKDPILEGKTSIKALIVEIKDDRFSARLPGESLSNTLFNDLISRLGKIDPL